MVKRAFQVQARRDGALVALVTRSYDEGEFDKTRAELTSARDAVIEEANAIGGFDDLVVHLEDSDGFVRDADG